MKTLDEKAAEYAESVVSRNKEAKECEGLIQTAYVLGAMKGELLGEETGTFGQALESLKRGHLVARKGWNGKKQYIQLATGISYKAADGEVVNCEHNAIGNMAVAFTGTSGVQMGWLASQADMLAEDWIFAE